MKKNKKTKTSIRDQIQENYPGIPFLFMDPEDYDKAIVGVCDGISVGHNPKIVYDYNKVIEVNMAMGMDREGAIEYFDFNQGDAYMGNHTPVFLMPLEE